MSLVKLASRGGATLAAAGVLIAGPLVTASAATTVCTGVTGCKIVASSDVDGDKKADQVGIVYKPATAKGSGSIAVRVKTASRIMQTTGRDVYWYYKPLFAVASIDGRAGKEVVVGDYNGANTDWARIVTFRDGQLVTLQPPTRNAARPSRWGVQSSNGALFGYWRTTSSAGVVTMTGKSALRNNTGKGYTGKNVSYAWKSGGWVKTSSKTVRYSSYSAARGIAGWHATGMPVWPV